ncbi:MAG: hypothetical protein IT577_12355 [Verrucomicrobiae bacterium]|nr:hypothetical protein [Verrucomicrobiae bacterium]
MCAALIAPTLCHPTETASLLKNGDFESGLEGWRGQGPAGAYAAGQGSTAEGKRGHAVFVAPPGANSSHLDQDVTLSPDGVYEATVRANADGRGLRPGLRICDAQWQTLAQDEAPADGEWHQLRAVFQPPPDGRVKVQLFGAGRENQGPVSGRTLFDDAALVRLSSEAARAALAATVTVHPDRIGHRIDPRFFGINALFWIEDDASRSDGKITAALKGMPCGLMRFPGGEVADNFHWRSNALDDIKDFPFEDGPDELDFDEFIRWRDEIGAEAICVANLETGFIRGDIGAAAREAAEWVRYSNVEKKFAVRYWEIGNESDLAGTRYPLRAEEYARAVVQFSKAMKAVDPSVSVGALGPFGHDHTAFLDNLTDEGLAQARSATRAQLKQKDRPFPRRSSPGPAWWPTVCEIAGGHFDFAIIHRYDATRARFGAGPAAPIRPGELVAGLDAFLKRALGREMPIALTEWNTNRNAELSPAEHGVSIAEMAMSYLAAGVDLANYWPMRYPSIGKAGFREMLDSRTNGPRPAYHAIRLMASRAGQRIVAADCPSPVVAALACLKEGDRELTVFAASRSARHPVALHVSAPGFSVVEAVALLPEPGGQQASIAPLTGSKGEASWSTELPPLGFARITLAH